MKVEIQNVDFAYPGEDLTLHGISLTFDKPGLVCIIGPNGVGKSTLIRCINKLLKPTGGDVLLDGKSIEEYSLKDLSKVMGYVPANSDDYFPMTVIETILMGRHPHNSWSYTDEDKKIVYDCMKMMSVEHLAMRNFGELSAGQHQRVMLARGLAQKPDILILDEPTANLDVRHQLLVTEIVRDLAVETGTMIIMVSHDLNVASKYADQIVVMSTPGIVYKVGTPQDVITEDTIGYVYGVRSQVIQVEGRPHVILLEAMTNDEVRALHSDETIDGNGE